MRLVILESPYASKSPAGLERNINYARACMKDSITRGEAPFASHLLYPQPGILDDNNPVERSLGMNAGFAWLPFADATVVYMDLGISPGMREGIKLAESFNLTVEYRAINTPWEDVDIAGNFSSKP